MNNKVFNNPVEVGVRTLVILNESRRALDLQLLIFYDFLTLHFGDVDSQYQSLHPSNPLHSTEFIVMRRIIRAGIDIVSMKGLVDIIYSSEGISYKSNEYTDKFLSYFESPYFLKLKFNAQLVSSKFDEFTQKSLASYFFSNLGNWKGEFDKEVIFRGGTRD